MLDSYIASQLKKTLEASVNNHEIAGANFMVIKDGKEVFTTIMDGQTSSLNTL